VGDATPTGARLNVQDVGSIAKEGNHFSADKKAMHGRVEEGRGVVCTVRLPSPLIKPDVRISRIRLSDWFHVGPTT
jgi:hypothetical protein